MPVGLFACLMLIYLTVLMFFSYLLRDNYSKPFFVIIVYWLSMLLLSNYSPTGLFVPSIYAQILLSVSFMFFSIGYYFCLFMNRKLYNNDVRVETATYLAFNYRRINFLVALPSIFIFVMLFIAIKYIYTNGYTSYLLETRWNEGDVNFLFDFIPGFYFIISVFIKPFVLALFFSFFALSRFFDVFKNYLYLSIALVFSLSFIYSSRVEVIIIFLAFVFDFLVPRENKKIKNQFYFLFSSVFFIGILLFASYMRAGGESGQVTLIDLFNRYVVEYHLFGFTMFDIGVQRVEDNVEHVFSLFLSTVSIILYPFEKLANLVGIQFISPAMSARYEMLAPVFVGNKDSNAFYTVFYLFYRDAGYFGLVFFSFLLGYTFKRYLLKMESMKVSIQSVKGYSLSNFVFYTCYVALMFPPQSQETYWFTLIYIYIFFYILKLKRQ